MADKKKTDWGPDSPSLNDFSFDMDDFGGRAKNKGEKKRKPIMKVATNVAKGSLSHFTSEQFIRGTIRGSLPKGYDAAIDTSYEIKGTFNQLYNTAAEEYRKMRPQLQQTLNKMMPAANKMLPKSLADRLNKFSKAESFSGGQVNPDEQMLRSILGELEQGRESERLREYTEKSVKDQLQEQIDSRRFNSNIKALASIDARMAQMQAFNDQVFSRYQKRSLEVMYRQYFTQRDILKVVGTEMAASRQLLTAILHNTGLPDMDKRKLTEQIGNSIKSRLASMAPLAISKFTGGFMGNLRDRVAGRIQGTGTAASNALSGAGMGMDMHQMARGMGMDTGGQLLQMLGGAGTGFLAEQLLSRIGSGFAPGGFTAQKGAKLGRMARNLPETMNKWAGSRTKSTGWKGTGIQAVKDLIGRNQQNNRIGSSGILEAGEPAAFTKKTQRSIEEIIPGFLSKIHHELAIMRTGNDKTAPVVWNDDADKFTTAKEKTAAIQKRVTGSAGMKHAHNSARDLADFMSAGQTLSPQAHTALTRQILHNTINGKSNDVGELIRGRGEHIAPHRKELAKLRGRFKGAGGKQDQVLLGQFQERANTLRTTTPNVLGQLSAYRDLGSHQDLRDLGWLTEEGDNVSGNTHDIVKSIVGHETGARNSKYKRGDYGAEGMYHRPRKSLDDILHGTYVNLYKPGNLNEPVIVGTDIPRGKYVSATTGDPIHTMEGLLVGVSRDGRLVASAEDVIKLVTASKESLKDFMARTARQKKTGTKGKLAAAMDKHIYSLGTKFDNYMDTGHGAHMWKQATTGKGRQQTAAHLHAHAATATQSVKASVAKAAASSPSMYESLSKSVKSGWTKAMNVAQHATDLYAGSSVRPVIDAARLKAGEYISALTGKPIKDMRNIVDGVKDGKSGQWVVSATDAIDTLHNASGEKFSDLVQAAQAVMEQAHVAASTTSATLKGHAAAAHRAVSNSTQSVHEAIHEAATVDHHDPMMEVLNAFKEGNLKLLEEILDVVSRRDFTQTGGLVMGEKGHLAGLKSKGKTFGDRLKGLGKGAWGTARKAGSAYGSYVKTAFKLPFKAVGGVFSLAGRALHKSDKLGKEPADVYVKGDKAPRLTRGRMMAGDYFNTKPIKGGGMSPSTVIRVPKDISGPVMDKDGNTLIDLEEFKKGITDRSGHSFAGTVVRGLWSTVSTLAGFYGSLISAPIKAISMAGNFAVNVLNVGKRPIDIYVKGDTPWEPRIRAIGMRAGIYVLKDKPSKKIRSPQDITGEVLDISKNPPELVISNSDISKGLVTIKGKPIPMKGAGMMTRLAGGALGMVGSLAGGAMRTIGAMGRLGGKIAMSPFNLLSHMLGMGPFGKKTKMPKDGFPTSDEKTHGLLHDILSTLQARLTKPGKHRSNSYQDELKAHSLEEAAEEAKKKAGLAGAAGAAAAGGASNSGAGDLLSKLKNGKDMLKGGWKAAKGLLGKGKKAAGWLKNILKGGKGLGGAAEAAEGAEGAVGAGEAIAGGASAAEGIAAAGAVAVEGGGAMAGAAAAGGTILTGIAAVLSAPVVLGALAVGAIAYGAYKLYSNAKLKAMKMRSLRMAQYGVDVGQDLSNSKTVGDLEALLEPHVTVENGKASINTSEMKKDDLVKITKIFGFSRSNWNPLNWFHHADAKEVNQQKAMADWMEARFKPVFINWMGALHQVDPKSSISDIDTLKPEQQRAILKSVMVIDAHVYGLMASPFQDDPLTAGKKEVDAAYQAVLKALGPETKDKGGSGSGGGGPAAVAAAAATAKSATGLKSAIPAKAAIAGAGAAGALEAATKNTTGKGASTKIGVSQTGTLKSDFGFLGGKVSALTAVRYKTYGLTEMDPTKAKAFFLVEQDVFEKIEFGSDGTASFKDDASYYFDHYAGYFGISPTDADAKVRWYSWFAKRFVPTILQYSTAVKHANKTIDPRDAENYLSPAHLLDVASMTIAATFGSMLTAASVWSFTGTPFDDKKPLNGDANSTKDNIQALKDNVQKQVMAEQTAKQPSATAATTAQAAAAASTGSSTANTSAKSAVSNAAALNQAVKAPTVKAASTQAPMVAKAPVQTYGAEAGSQAASDAIAAAGAGGKPGAPVGTAVTQPGHGTGGDINKIPQPTGSGYPAVKATLDAAAKMAGIDPKLLGIFTGIESGWNPSAHAGTSSASGLMQFITSTWRAMITKYGAKYGIAPNTPQTDARASALLGAEFVKENQAYLTKHLGRSPTDTELYIAHFLGPAGAVQLLSAPDGAIGAAVAPKAASANAPIFYKSGAALSKAQIVKLLDGKVGKFRSKVSGPGPTTPATGDAAMASTTLPDGAKTTTTANGGKGGLGAGTPAPGEPTAASAAAGSQGLASISPPSGGAPLSMPSIAPGMSAVNDSGSDAVVTQQGQQQQKAAMQDRQAQATGAAQQATSGDMANNLKKQTDLMTQMVQYLATITGHTSALPDMAKAAGVTGPGTASTTVPNPNAPPTTPGGMTGVPQQANLPGAPVSVARPSYG